MITLKEIEDIKITTDQINESVSTLKSSLNTVQLPLYEILKEVYSIGDINDIKLYDETIEFSWETLCRGDHAICTRLWFKSPKRMEC